MSRSLFLVLAIVALLVSVTAQDSSSSSYGRVLSSSSSSVAASSSTGAYSSTGTDSNTTGVSPSTGSASSSSSSSAASSSATMFTTSVTGQDALPAGSYSLQIAVSFDGPITNATETAVLVAQDIAFNVANETGTNVDAVLPYVIVTSVNGTAVGSSSSRRLLQTGAPITFILLGTITRVVGDSGFTTSSVVAAFVAAASNGTLAAPYSGATIYKQTVVAPTPVGAWPSSSSSSSSSSSGEGSPNGASTVSTGAALLFAAVASLALLL